MRPGTRENLSEQMLAYRKAQDASFNRLLIPVRMTPPDARFYNPAKVIT
jgi:hypothetical protein